LGAEEVYSQPRRVAPGRGMLLMARVALAVQSARGAEGGGCGMRRLAGIRRRFDWAKL